MKLPSTYILFLFLSFYLTMSAEEGYMFRLHLKDKGKSQYTVDHPEEFLSLSAIKRRQKQGIAIDTTDLPIDTSYIRQIACPGITVKAVSKWVGTVTVHVNDSNLIAELNQLPFIDSSDLVWRGIEYEKNKKVADFQSIEPKIKSVGINSYGAAFTQIHLHQGDLLHEAGFRGEDMKIAVIDGGFANSDKIDVLNPAQILGVKQFSHNNSNPLTSKTDHGTKVLSCMLSNKSGVIIGTAPAANYYLISTESPEEEFPVEEDYWIAGVEYADSLGVDVVTSSLGYSVFEDSTMSHTHKDLDGESVPISRAAGMAVDKGMIVLIAAGNEGNKPWRKISLPSDAYNVLCIGSVNAEGIHSNFSSVGLSADGRIKPDLVSMGQSTAVVDASGSVINGSGTSFASPVLAGLLACLWQALPDCTNKEVIELLKADSNQHQAPDSLVGYGIPDVYKTYMQNKKPTLLNLPEDPKFLYIDARENRLYVNISQNQLQHCALTVFSSFGSCVLKFQSPTESIDISSLNKGIYIAMLRIDGRHYIRKFVKF